MICDFSGAMRSVLAAACVEIGVAREARPLNSETLQQCRAYCAGWKEWADTACKRAADVC